MNDAPVVHVAQTQSEHESQSASETSPSSPSSPSSRAQMASTASTSLTDEHANTIFAEALGNGLLYSLNYERLLLDRRLGLRAGASFFAYRVSRAEGSGTLKLASFPIVASWYFGPADHKLQLGLGATILYFGASSDSTGTKFEGDVDGLGIAATAMVGYRYLPRDGWFTFGAGFTPLLRTTKGFLPWGGANAGIIF